LGVRPLFPDLLCMDQQRIYELAWKWRQGNISEQEMTELNSLYNKADDQEAIILPVDFAADETAHAGRIWSEVNKRTGIETDPVQMYPPRKKRWPQLAMAASFLLVLAAGAYLWWRPVPQKEQLSQQVPAGIVPGREGAILTLADGSELALDSVGNGLVARENGARVMMKDQQLIYESENTSSNNTLFNTMSTPRGRQFLLSLPDGTKVWLNSASSIRYPVKFTANERKVVITGEAYLEVAKDPSKPFKVAVDDMEIDVLGTSFNVNAYANESKMRTTLLEGAVRVRFDTDRVLLKPGDQAVLTNIARTNGPGEKFSIDQKVDAEQVVAWKNGIFNFNNADLFTVMRQLERWYDIEVEYEGNVAPLKFFGKMRRDLPLSVVLEWLKGVGVNYKFDKNNKLIIMP
jgi:transmembrane sensor